MADIDISRFSNHVDLKDIQRFISYIKIDPVTNAWLWCGGITGNGYGAFWYKNKTVSAHRFSYELANGLIGDSNLFVCHKYENLGKHNVNPDHLFLGTIDDNMKDASQKGRMPYGEKNHQVKLTEKDVICIRDSKLTYQELSKIYKVSMAKISHIKRGQSWVNMDGVKKATIHSLANETGYRGVRIDKNPRLKRKIYRADITVTFENEKKTFHLGSFRCPIEAAKAYDQAAIKYRGKSAKTNFKYD